MHDAEENKEKGEGLKNSKHPPNRTEESEEEVERKKGEENDEIS